MEHEIFSHTTKRTWEKLLTKKYFKQFVVLGLFIVFLVWVSLTNFSPAFNFGTAPSYIDEKGREIFIPEPIRASRDASNSLITQNGIIEWTNTHRAEAGLSPLIKNTKSTASAAAKVHDIFEKQSFEHIASEVKTVSELADRQGYDFPFIGELIAIGNFQNDEELVAAWMKSRGNRALILSADYKFFGVAIGRHEFEGKEVWAVVQHLTP